MFEQELSVFREEKNSMRKEISEYKVKLLTML